MPAVKPVKEIKITNFRVKYKDIFDLKQLYDDMHLWLEEYGWTDLEDGMDHYETLYLEKIDSGGFKELWMKWSPQKVPHGNDYYRFWIDINFHCIAIKSTEIVKGGHKLKVHKGEVEIMSQSIMELDYKDKWSKHWILKYFQKIFPERIYRKEIYEQHKKEFYRETYEFQNFIKRWMKLKRHLPYEETKSFHPSFAWPSHKKD